MQDSVGNGVHEGAILKVFHFVGANRKQHFMYKQVGEMFKGKRKMYHLPKTHKDAYYLVDEKSTLTQSLVIQCYCKEHPHGLKSRRTWSDCFNIEGELDARPE